MQSLVIHRVTALDLTVQRRPWPFAEAKRAEIDAYFAEEQRKKPEIWNGQVLIGRDAHFSGGRLTANYFETDFASFLAWRDWGFPDKDVFNGFGMGALLSSDGAFALGVMGGHTVNAGRIYFPSGTPDLSDIRGDTVDIPGSVVRELEEETGLIPGDYQLDADWHVVATGPAIAMMKIVRVDLPGSTLRAKLEANLAAQSEPELAGIHLVRTRDDFTATMPHFVTAFIETQLPG
ncbi:NUDIX hydrolase [Bradyrhizobium jicamae]|uniref:NUDIX hydrolase n=1 Tax=Bradyrhizobium jicamae TaxID=280332 RepID=UPI001BA633DB|nr:NUDIX hydrolase [Bradyrhizobium jicamae]MBR0751545.1 NUDIX hydrolase [Bradyrhizobium jicamae]